MEKETTDPAKLDAHKHTRMWVALAILMVLLAVTVALLAIVMITRWPFGSQPIANVVNQATNSASNNAANNATAPANNAVVNAANNATTTPSGMTEEQLAALVPTRALYGTYDFSGGQISATAGDFTAFADGEQLFKSSFGPGNTFSVTAHASPNGRLLAITVMGGSPNLYVSQVDGTNLHKVKASLPFQNGGAGTIVWSPDSKAMFFVTVNDKTQKEVLNVYDVAADTVTAYDRRNEQSYLLQAATATELFTQVYNARHSTDSTSLHAIPIKSGHVLSGDAKSVLIDHAAVRNVAVSPDGNFVASAYPTPCDPNLPQDQFCNGQPFLLDVLNRKSGQTTNARTLDQQYIGAFAFTPDNGSVLYSYSDVDNGPSGMASVRVDGTKARTIISAPTGAQGSAPYFYLLGTSVDGQNVIFQYSGANAAYPRLATVSATAVNLGVSAIRYLGSASKPSEFFGWTQ